MDLLDSSPDAELLLTYLCQEVEYGTTQELTLKEILCPKYCL